MVMRVMVVVMMMVTMTMMMKADYKRLGTL